MTNIEKSDGRRDYTFVAENHKNKKCVKATNIDTNEISYYNSMYAISQHLGINAGIVKMVCEGLNRCKTGISKRDNFHYKFEYVNEQDMPDDFKKSANKRTRRVLAEDKKKHQKEALKRWQQKEYECKNCGKTYKNGYKFFHKKNVNISLTAVTTNTRPIAFKRLGQSCVLVDVNQRKAVGIIFEYLQDSKATWQGIENFTSLREGKSCLN